ncbi:putative chitobiose transport system permease protein [Symbiobacterium terraclitae]|uniref:Chitobiose transport system permease protein n=1 Tax=Symbiobacterium terraclitae TaxID=557451 RepID=A0ABS4JVS9_9FIRM|nr:carbohydrate ABC transporter permease [Symbiobacterium terraclitae]MBP2019614.1 putative chitobiose transport system permease protein [Symbiobacterium terraclitae]
MTAHAVKRAGKVRTLVKNTLLYLVMTAIALLMVFPFLWLLSTSFKTASNVYAFPPQMIPNPATLDNYVGVTKMVPIWRYLKNTAIITALGVGLNVLFSTLAAYPLARMRFPGRDIIFGALLSTMIIPNGAGMIVNYMTLRTLRLTDTFLGVVLPSAATIFSIFLLRQAYTTIPKELEEAARIDGAGDLFIWWRIMVPLIRPTLLTVVIFDFMAHWNSFIWPVVVMKSPDNYPLAAGLLYLQGQFSYNFLYLAAGTVISITPMIILFLLLQKYFINGVAGAVKG